MPNQTRVRELISWVEQRRFMDALQEFYHEEAALQENDASPRLGLTACLDHEERFLASVRAFHEVRAASFVADGDRAAIHWVFDVTLRDGRRVRREEIAYQRWEGDRIICERFFYDPAGPSSGPGEV